MQSRVATKSIYVHEQVAWCNEKPKKKHPTLTTLSCLDVAEVDIFCSNHQSKQTQRKSSSLAAVYFKSFMRCHFLTQNGLPPSPHCLDTGIHLTRSLPCSILFLFVALVL